MERIACAQHERGKKLHILRSFHSEVVYSLCGYMFTVQYDHYPIYVEGDDSYICKRCLTLFKEMKEEA